MEQTRYFLGRAAAVICSLVLLCLAFSACSSDDDPVVTPSNPDNPTEEPIDTARYTIIVYGNAGGTMDNIMEGVFEATQPLIKLGGDIRLIYCYKYGGDAVDDAGNHSFTGKYAEPGSVVYFEIHDKLDLNLLRENSGVYKEFELFNHYNLTYMLNDIAKNAPARDYIFVLWGHGGGFDANYDIPFNLKLPADELTGNATRGVLYDELLDNSAMDMYEFSRAIEDSDIDKFKCIFFHNCMMGNLESLTQIQPYTEYIISSAHLLYSGGQSVGGLTEALTQIPLFEDAAQAMFEWLDPMMPYIYMTWDDELQAPKADLNGDLNMIKADKLPDINKQIRRLANWLCYNYPTQKEAIDRATDKVYLFVKGWTFFDVADYADKLAEETGDANVLAISRDLRQAFDDAFVHRIKVIRPDFPKDMDFTLSTVLIDNNQYIRSFPLANYSYGLIYSGTEFHQQTGWGNWLSTNTHSPTGNPWGQNPFGL